MSDAPIPIDRRRRAARAKQAATRRLIALVVAVVVVVAAAVVLLWPSGPTMASVTIRPGEAIFEVAAALRALPQTKVGYGAAFERDALQLGQVRSPFQPASVVSLEGLLGTGTYHFVADEPPSALLSAMVRRFTAQAAALGLTPTTTVEGHDAYAVVTVASIVEKEGWLPQNLGQVSRVIYNRLAVGQPLQMDSTVLYPLRRDGGRVTPSMLQVDTPFNTYLHAGLTPTPVCQPGPAALVAAMHPTPGTWRYFVVVSRDGTEAFATTYAEHLANIARAKANGL